MEQGKGDPGLSLMAPLLHPTHISFVREFMLLDNFMASGMFREGHQWTDASIVTDYIEKNMRHG